jgi:hypothetical protein
MEISSFAIWKFRYVEGFLQGFHAFDMETSKYVDPFTFATTWIRYNFKAETAEIERPDGTKIEVSFSGLVQKLKDLGMYVERGEHERHHLAGPQKDE